MSTTLTDLHISQDVDNISPSTLYSVGKPFSLCDALLDILYRFISILIRLRVQKTFGGGTLKIASYGKNILYLNYTTTQTLCI